MTPCRSSRSIRLWTVVRESFRRRAISAVEARAFSRSTVNSCWSEAVIFMGSGLLGNSTKHSTYSVQIYAIDRRFYPDNSPIAPAAPENPMAVIDKLAPLRAHGGTRRTVGLHDAVVARFAQSHPDLVEAIDAAAAEYARIKGEIQGGDLADLLDLDEDAQLHAVQAGFVNFYPDDGVNPYVALTARGPWVITLKGAVLHDSGGYGMLGFGHAPKAILEAMAKPQAMANIMTASVSQLRF